MLSYICTMKVIVVFYRSFVLIVYLDEELEKLMVVNRLKKVVLFQKRGSHERHLHVSSHGLWELKDVEVVRVDSIKEMEVVLN